MLKFPIAVEDRLATELQEYKDSDLFDGGTCSSHVYYYMNLDEQDCMYILLKYNATIFIDYPIPDMSRNVIA